MNLIRLAHRWLWSAPRRSLADAVRFQTAAHVRAIHVVRIFYGCSAVWPLLQARSWKPMVDAEAAMPQAPAWWLDAVGLAVGVPLILIVYTLTALLAAALPHRRLARLAYAVAFLQYMSLENGFGKIGGGPDAWFFVSAVLVLLPTGPWRRPSRIAEQRSFLMVLWFAQLSVMFAYTLTGYWKVAAALLSLRTPEISAFHPYSFAIVLAELVTTTGKEPLFADFLLQWPLVGWALFDATMYLELTSILVAFRPRLHRLWGIAIIGLHLGTRFAMDISFPLNVLLVGILFVCSPFTPERVPLRDAVLDLPGLRFASRRLAGRRGTTSGSFGLAPDAPAAPLAAVGGEAREERR